MEGFFKRKKKHCFSGGKLVKNIFQENSDGTGWVQEIQVHDRFGYAVYDQIYHKLEFHDKTNIFGFY